MAPYNPMKKHMDKLDEWGSDKMKKFNSQRDAGSSGSSMSDRLKIARGKDDRWERTARPVGSAEDGTQEEIVPNRASRLPPPPSNFRGANAGPPPPPQRNNSGVAAPPPVAASRPPPPTLPRRMDNENGTSHPPPPYPATKTAPPPPPARGLSQRSSQGSNLVNATETDHFEFSKFNDEDKEAFFDLLDEVSVAFQLQRTIRRLTIALFYMKKYFAQRLNVSSNPSSGKLSSAASKRISNQNSSFPANTSATVAPSSHAIPQPSSISNTKATNIRHEPPKPSGPKVTVSQQASSSTTNQASLPQSTSNQSWSYPRLSASNHPSTEPCKALSCASFLVYRDSYPDEWSGQQPWYTKRNAIPLSLQGRRDISWSSSTMMRGSENTLFGASLFEDLSCLWWKISWNSGSPSKSVTVDVAYREPPLAFMDEGRLIEASKGFGDWIAGFAEQHEREKSVVGDGECWTLAAEAIKYTNSTAQLNEDNRLLTSIGRTHGHLIYAAKADPKEGQCGRWRGGDRVRQNWGGIRRGDIVEWKTARCREVGGPKGSYMTLGAPEHTAIIIANSPVPERLSQKSVKRKDDHYSILGVKTNASQAEIRSAYLAGARKHHPDRFGAAGRNDDDFIQRLNEAHTILSDVRLRQEYDEQLQQGKLKGKQQSNQTRISSTIDLESMEAMEAENQGLTFFYPCRCGNGFYLSENQLQHLKSNSIVIGCSGCSERIRVMAGEATADGEDEDQEEEQEEIVEEVEEGDDDDQPELLPWEIGSITTIEQSAGQLPTKRSYDLSLDSFTQGEIWIYRPIWEKEYLGGAVKPNWPPTLSNWQSL